MRVVGDETEKKKRERSGAEQRERERAHKEACIFTIKAFLGDAVSMCTAPFTIQ